MAPCTPRRYLFSPHRFVLTIPGDHFFFIFALALRYAKEGEPEVRERDVYSTRRGERLTGQLRKLAPFIPEEVVCLHWGCQLVLVCKHDMGTPRIMEMGISMAESRNSWRGQSS